MFNKIIKNEESLQNLVTMAVLILFLISYGLAGLDWYLVAGLAVYMVILMVVVNYLSARSKYRIDKLPDERTARITQIASRNGYIAGLLATGAIAVIAGTGYFTPGLREALLAVYLVMINVQLISYAYYLNRRVT